MTSFIKNICFPWLTEYQNYFLNHISTKKSNDKSYSVKPVIKWNNVVKNVRTDEWMIRWFNNQLKDSLIQIINDHINKCICKITFLKPQVALISIEQSFSDLRMRPKDILLACLSLKYVH